MPPFADNLTWRFRMGYSGPFGRHSMLLRFATETDQEAVPAAITPLITAITAIQWDGVTWDTCERSSPGSVFFLPVAWTPIVGDSSLGPNGNSAPGTFMQFGGRETVSGHRAKWYVFECALPYQNDMRYQAGESAPVDAIIAAFTALSPDLVSITDDPVVMYPYANVGQNDHITHKARRGA